MRPRHFAILVAAAALFIPAMLIADGPSIPRQLLVGLATGLFLFLVCRHSKVSPVAVVAAMVIATTGELVLSLGWGLYGYRYAAVPYFVPFGHGIFYALATAASQQPFLLARRRAIVGFVALFGSAVATASVLLARDTWGLLWWGVVLLLLARSKEPLLLAMAYVFTMPLEWLGTWIGNWYWFADVPYLPLTSANPPSGVGMLYGLLDVLTVLACSSPWIRRLAGGRPAEDDLAREAEEELAA